MGWPEPEWGGQSISGKVEDEIGSQSQKDLKSHRRHEEEIISKSGFEQDITG